MTVLRSLNWVRWSESLGILADYYDCYARAQCAPGETLPEPHPFVEAVNQE